MSVFRRSKQCVLEDQGSVLESSFGKFTKIRIKYILDTLIRSILSGHRTRDLTYTYPRVYHCIIWYIGWGDNFLELNTVNSERSCLVQHEGKEEAFWSIPNIILLTAISRWHPTPVNCNIPIPCYSSHCIVLRSPVRSWNLRPHVLKPLNEQITEN
jgi:hypothetical protein